MSKRVMTCVLALMAVLAVTQAAEAQYSVPGTSQRSIGEKYWVEVMAGLWNPTPQGLIQSGQFGQPGDSIDFIDDLGYEKKSFRDFRFVLRPARKHKLRAQYVPVTYNSETVFERSLIFNGQRYDVALPVNTQFDWKVWRFAYEYDFVSREKIFAGFIVEVKYTQVQAALQSVLNDEFTSAKGPVPSVGGILRYYVLPNASITFELSGIKTPLIDDRYEAKYIDWDLFGTYNVTNNFGVTAGYRVMDVMFLADKDGGEMSLKGLYFGGLVRF